MKINTSFEIEDFVVTQKLCVIYPVGRTFAKYTRLDDNLTRQRGNNSFFFIFLNTSTFQHLDNKPLSQVSSLPVFLPSIFVANRVQQSHCSSIFHRVLLTPALILSASQLMYKKKSPQIYTSMHSGGLELTKLTHNTSLEDNLSRHQGDDSSLTHTTGIGHQHLRVLSWCDTWYVSHTGYLLWWRKNTHD